MLFAPGPTLDGDLPTYTSYVTEITDVSHHAECVCFDGVLLTPLTVNLVWPQTVILPISASEVAGITDMSHQAQCLISYLGI
jgi:hypothetical protein